MKQWLLAFFIFLTPGLFGGFSCVKGKWSPDKFVPSMAVQEHYDFGCRSLDREEWDEALVHFLIITYHFNNSPFYADSLYFSAVSYLHLNELDLANKQFNNYLNLSGKLKYFEKIFDLKFQIAESYRNGVRKHLFGIERLPKWSSAKTDALLLYDEIVAALPGREIAAQSLFCKAQFLRQRREYREAIESLKILQRNFSKHPLTVESYLLASEIYLDVSHIESQNPDLLALAQLNLTRFSKQFPLEERIKQVEDNLLEMREVYASSLYETGRFYERKKKPSASAIYYQDTVLKYPDTLAAKKSKERLEGLILKRL